VGAAGGLDGANTKYSAIPARISAATRSQRRSSGRREGAARSFISATFDEDYLRMTRDAVNLTASRILP
jgi:hypothetical protein